MFDAFLVNRESGDPAAIGRPAWTEEAIRIRQGRHFVARDIKKLDRAWPCFLAHHVGFAPEDQAAAVRRPARVSRIPPSLADYGNSSQDQRHIFSGSAVYKFPFERGRPLAAM